MLTLTSCSLVMVYRSVRRPPGTRRTHPRDAERHPDPHDAGRPRQARRPAHRLLCVLSLLYFSPLKKPIDLIDRTQWIRLRRNTKPSTVVTSLQLPSGAFAGDRFGETDTRFLYIAVQALSLLGQLDVLDKNVVDGKNGRERAVAYIERCRNFDGGFGANVDAESHSGQGPSSFLSSFTCPHVRMST